MLNDAKSRKQIFKDFVEEWAADRDDMTDLNEAIWKAGSYKDSALEKMKNTRGKIKGTAFPFEPSEF
jgi:hypothetical protein